MKAILLLILAAMLGAAMPGVAYSAAIETADLTGTGTGATAHHGVTAITDALAAVSDGGTVQITEAGTYNSLTLIGGKTYTIQGMVNGIIVGGSTNTGTAPSLGINNTSGVINATLKDFMVLGSNTGNTNGCFDFAAGANTQITFNNVDIVVDPSNSAMNQKAMHISPTTVAVDTLRLDFTSCTLQSGRAGGNGILVNGAPATLASMTCNFTTCTIYSPSSEMFWIKAQPLQAWNFQGCQMTAANSMGFELRDVISNATFNFTDTSIKVRTYFIRDNRTPASASAGKAITLTRCTVDRATYGLSTDTQNLFDLNGTVGTSPNILKLYNCLIIDYPYASTATNTTINLIGWTGMVDYCTILGGGAGGAKAINVGTGGSLDINNCIIGNYINAPTVTGTQTALKNLIVGPTDTTVLGTHTYTLATAGLANATTAILLDPATYVPLAGSPVIDAANPDAGILGAVGTLDRLGHPRFMGSAPDLGAFESPGALPTVINPVTGFTYYH